MRKPTNKVAPTKAFSNHRKGKGKPTTFTDGPELQGSHDDIPEPQTLDDRIADLNAAGSEMSAQAGGYNPDYELAPGVKEVAVRQMGHVLKHIFNWDQDGENAKTPLRFLKYLAEFNKPYTPKDVLGELFNGAKAENIGGVIVQKAIPFRMICEHHLLPAVGHAWVGYIPRGKVVGLSKIARLVQAVGTSRPGMQELFCEEITDVLHDYTDANGTITVIDSLHTCMACRGVYTPDTKTSTSCVRGLFRDVPAARSEFFNLVGMKAGT